MLIKLKKQKQIAFVLDDGTFSEFDVILMIFL